MGKRYQEGDRLFAFEYNQLLDDVDILKENSGNTAGMRYDKEKDSNAEGTDETKGKLSTAEGVRSHAEGVNSWAYGKGSHAEGGAPSIEHGNDLGSIATGDFSHAEGAANILTSKPICDSYSSGPMPNIDVEELYLNVSGAASATTYTVTGGNYSAYPGRPVIYLDETTQKINKAVITDVRNNTITVSNTLCDTHAINGAIYFVTGSLGILTHTEGWTTTAMSECSHAEGVYTQALYQAAHAEGWMTSAYWGAHSEGCGTNAEGEGSHAQGFGSIACGKASHAEGYQFQVEIPDITFSWTSGTSFMTASETAYFLPTLEPGSVFFYQKPNSFERYYFSMKSIDDDGVTIRVDKPFNFTATNVTLFYAYGIAYGDGSHVEGYMNTAVGGAAHVDGAFNYAMGDYSHIDGYGNSTNNTSEHACGCYNKSNIGTSSASTLFSIGIGDYGARKNAFEVMQNGDAYMVGVGGYDGTNPQSATTVQNAFVKLCTLTQDEYDDLVDAGTVDAGTLYIISDAQ